MSGRTTGPISGLGAAFGYAPGMCRSIRTLRNQDDAATTGEVEAAARQYVRKVSGFRVPSARNSAAFDAAVAEIAAASQRLILAMGGDLSAESSMGHGSEFRVTLPFIEQAAGALW